MTSRPERRRPIQTRSIRVSVDEPVNDGRECVGYARRRDERPADPEQRLRFTGATGGVLGTLRLERDETADHDTDEQQQQQIQLLGRVLDDRA